MSLIEENIISHLLILCTVQKVEPMFNSLNYQKKVSAIILSLMLINFLPDVEMIWSH